LAAALAAGNTVLSKPAEETPLIAAQTVRLLPEAAALTRSASLSLVSVPKRQSAFVVMGTFAG
jgi:delta 1-pyrroline-5-carboxylate dehydrogenase